MGNDFVLFAKRKFLLGDFFSQRKNDDRVHDDWERSSKNTQDTVLPHVGCKHSGKEKGTVVGANTSSLLRMVSSRRRPGIAGEKGLSLQR